MKPDYCFLFLLLMMMSCSADEQTIRIKGSDTEVNLTVQLAETFGERKANDKVVTVSGGGSGMGIASLLNGTADIANSSRSINDEELDLFRIKKVVIDSFVFAIDAIAFVTSDNIKIDSISTRNLARILSGEINNWSTLGGENMTVTIYGRQSNSGTYDFVKHKLRIEFTPYAKQMNGNAQILEAIKTDRSGIGYVGAGYVTHGGSKGIKVLTIYSDTHPRAMSPLDSTTIAHGDYFFQRPLYQYYRKENFDKIRSFLDFEKTGEGQIIIRKSGYYEVETKTYGIHKETGEYR